MRWNLNKKDIKVKSEHHDYLTEKKIKLMGVNRHENNVFIDVNNFKYKIVKLNFKDKNGMSKEINIENNQKLNNAISQLSNKTKFIYLKEKKNSLDSNIEYYMSLYENEDNLNYKRSLIERIENMRWANTVEQVSCYAFIEDDSFDHIISVLSDVYAVEILRERQALMVVKALNNGLVLL